MFTIIDRYLIRQVLTPLIATLSIAALLLILERMLRLFDFVVNQGGPVEVVFRMLANLTPHYMGLAMPIGLFLGIVLAFRKISMSSEYDAMTSAGMSQARLMRPIMALSLFLMVINLILVGWVQPHSRYDYEGLVFDLRSGALGASIRVGEFVDIGDNTVLRIEGSHNNGEKLTGIFMERRKEGRSIAITAQEGRFIATSDKQIIMLRLLDGVLVDMNNKQNKPRVLTFAQQDMKINLPNPEPFRRRGGKEREQTLPELWTEMDNPAVEPALQAEYRANFHWRLMQSLTFLILPMLAIPMGMTNKRTGKGTGIVVGISILIVYNELMEGMETLVSKSGVSPFLSIWGLFVLYAVFSFLMFRTSAYKVGGEPLKWIDSAWAGISLPLARMSKKILGTGE